MNARHEIHRRQRFPNPASSLATNRDHVLVQLDARNLFQHPNVLRGAPFRILSAESFHSVLISSETEW